MKTQNQYLKDTIAGQQKEIQRLREVIENGTRENEKLRLEKEAILWALVGAKGACRGQEDELIELRKLDNVALAG